MYEKPQYFTKDGYKRLNKNPHRDDAPTLKLIPKKKTAASAQLPSKGIKLSDKSAKMIALALKEMLRDGK